MTSIRRELSTQDQIDAEAHALLQKLDGLSVAQVIVVLGAARRLLECGTAFDAQAASLNLCRQGREERDPSRGQ